MFLMRDEGEIMQYQGLKSRHTCFLFVLLFCSGLWAADFRAGVARVDITPELPIWMSGYAARKEPAKTILQKLWAKALVLEDKGGKRVALVSMDLIGLPAEVTHSVADRVRKEYGLERAQLLLNTSHTHSGPVVRPNLNVMYDMPAQDAESADRYRHNLCNRLVEVVGKALQSMKPAVLHIGFGQTGFAINRRQVTAKGMSIGVNPSGPVDHQVPVLRVQAEEGSLSAVLFGYACHNTTLGGDSFRIHGDYAGFAQEEIERKHPGTVALFFILCGADQNPNPRGTVEHAQRYGRELAEAVERTLERTLRSVKGGIRTSYRETQLEFAAHSRQQFEKELQEKDPFRQRRARLMLEAYDQGKPVRSIAYPVQAVRLGDDFAFLALGGEVVVDYSLRAKREFPRENLVVAGYCNDVACYIPSLRVLREGGYEPVDSMIYYAQPGPLAENVEETIFTSVHRVMARAGAK